MMCASPRHRRKNLESLGYVVSYQIWLTGQIIELNEGFPAFRTGFSFLRENPVRAHRHCWRENCGDTANNRGFCSVFLWNPLISAASESVWDLPVAMPGSRPIEAAATVCLVLHHEMAWVVGRVAAIFRKWTIILFQRKLLEKCKQCRNDYVL